MTAKYNRTNPKILLVNPAIHDFTAYDFWLKPYGLLSVAGYLRNKADFELFDFLDRSHRFYANHKKLKSDEFGRGRFYSEKISNPRCLSQIPRYFRRFGLPRNIFIDFLKENGPFDFVLVQTVMTYWYQGISEIIQDVRKYRPKAKIILGGNYVTLCENHAKKLGADLLVPGTDLGPLWDYLNLEPDSEQPTLWQVYENLDTGVLKLSDGCPFKCTYCSVPKVYKQFKPRSIQRSLTELRLLAELGVGNIAFYDDALLFEAEKMLMPFLEQALRSKIKVNFHTPNALNARFINKELADLMIRAGFKTFYLGFESASAKWQRKTGSKVFSDELKTAVMYLTAAGADPKKITAYQILGHPDSNIQQLEDSMQFVNSLGVRGMLADFSPIPGTVDGEYCRKWVDMDEPLMHNKTAFPTILLGVEQAGRMKDLQRKLNRNLY